VKLGQRARGEKIENELARKREARKEIEEIRSWRERRGSRRKEKITFS
jgi:hypothetical protein